MADEVISDQQSSQKPPVAVEVGNPLANPSADLSSIAASVAAGRRGRGRPRGKMTTALFGDALIDPVTIYEAAVEFVVIGETMAEKTASINEALARRSSEGWRLKEIKDETTTKLRASANETFKVLRGHLITWEREKVIG